MTTQDDDKITLREWTHPSTGEVRLYVNHAILGIGDKAFFTQKGMGAEHCQIQVFTYNKSHTGLIENSIYKAVEKLGLDPLCWEDVKNLVN